MIENKIDMNISNSEDVYKAIEYLQSRVTQLEKAASVRAISGDGSDARPALAVTLENLKTLRTSLFTSCTEVDEKMKELDSVKKENEKLKYRIKHLLRSLEAEEKK